ncbi:SDR family NAD(P)-dependent oxidoreductase [Dactylosporangium sp. NPDC000555]|uniref:SDR family NAD(P)-dependent oxidoreductase n=1 Tax=Dactylosporangium sp. NPDC000555 TaxID=3154260 RepID=UPI00331FE863
MAGLIVVGAGPLIGTSTARRFAADGLPVALVARSEPTVRAAVEAVRGAASVAVHGFVADVTDEPAIRAALDEAVAAIGVPEVVLYNAAHVRYDALGELSAAQLLDTLAVNVVGGVTVAGHLAPAMVASGGGSLLFTGGMPEAKPGAASLSLGKAGLRTVAELLHEQYGPQGLHVATVTVSDVVAPGTAYDPDIIAEEFAALHREPRDSWRREILFRRG